MFRAKSLLLSATAMLYLAPESSCLAAQVTTLVSFAVSGPSLNPVTGVAIKDGVLFGTTLRDQSGANSGTIFQIDLTTLAESTDYVFRGNTGAYGSTTDGTFPSQLINVGGVLYGTTLRGGANYDGIVFKFNPASGNEVIIHQFDSIGGATPGALYSQDSLARDKAQLYGTASSGGANNSGTIFRISKGGAYSTVHDFASDGGGCDPVAGVVVFSGKLYGTTQGCGSDGNGTVYSLDLSTAEYKVLYSFKQHALANKLLLQDGSVFGTTTSGGVDNLGSVYKVDPRSGSYELVHSFSKTEVYNPPSGLVELNGILYGTGTSSASGNGGGIYSINPKTGKEKVETYFSGQNVQPYGALLVYNGSIYGTSSNLQPLTVEGAGTVYKFDP